MLGKGQDELLIIARRLIKRVVRLKGIVKPISQNGARATEVKNFRTRLACQTR
jgi:hypothetical protein